MDKYDKQCEPLVTSKSLFDTFYKEANSGDLIALYMHYYYVAKWQETNTAWSTTGYTAEALDWSVAKVRQTKKVLIRLGLIEDITSQNETGKFSKSFIYVRFMFSDEKVREAKEIAQCTALCDNRTAVKVETNALRDGRENALSSDILKPPTPFLKSSINRRTRTNNLPLRPERPQKPIIPFLDRFSPVVKTDLAFQSIWNDFVIHRKVDKRRLLSDRAVTIIVNEIDKYCKDDIEHIISQLTYAIKSGNQAPNFQYAPWKLKDKQTQDFKQAPLPYTEVERRDKPRTQAADWDVFDATPLRD
jgi:hypothetical protein